MSIRDDSVIAAGRHVRKGWGLAMPEVQPSVMPSAPKRRRRGRCRAALSGIGADSPTMCCSSGGPLKARRDIVDEAAPSSLPAAKRAEERPMAIGGRGQVKV